jgi:hypothetical protein
MWHRYRHNFGTTAGDLVEWTVVANIFLCWRHWGASACISNHYHEYSVCHNAMEGLTVWRSSLFFKLTWNNKKAYNCLLFNSSPSRWNSYNVALHRMKQSDYLQLLSSRLKGPWSDVGLVCTLLPNCLEPPYLTRQQIWAVVNNLKFYKILYCIHHREYCHNYKEERIKVVAGGKNLIFCERCAEHIFHSV